MIILHGLAHEFQSVFFLGLASVLCAVRAPVYFDDVPPSLNIRPTSRKITIKALIVIARLSLNNLYVAVILICVELFIIFSLCFNNLTRMLPCFIIRIGMSADAGRLKWTSFLHKSYRLLARTRTYQARSRISIELLILNGLLPQLILHIALHFNQVHIWLFLACLLIYSDLHLLLCAVFKVWVLQVRIKLFVLVVYV